MNNSQYDKIEEILKFTKGMEKAIKEVSLETGIEEDIVSNIFYSILDKSKGVL